MAHFHSFSLGSHRATGRSRHPGPEPHPATQHGRMDGHGFESYTDRHFIRCELPCVRVPGIPRPGALGTIRRKHRGGVLHSRLDGDDQEGNLLGIFMGKERMAQCRNFLVICIKKLSCRLTRVCNTCLSFYTVY